MFLLKHFNKPDKSLKMSAPPEYELHGVKIRKLTVGKYVQVMRTMEDLPQILAGGLFPEGIDMGEIWKLFLGLAQDKMIQLAVRLLTVVPEQACRLISGLLDIPEELLLDSDKGLSLTELVEIIEAFCKVNDMTDFFETVRRLAGNLPISQADFIGSSSGLR